MVRNPIDDYENLICMCSNCHTRADYEKWDSKTYEEYKKNPWVFRNPNLNADHSQNKADIEIEFDLESMDYHQRERLRYALAGFLEINPKAIRIKE